MAGGELVPAAGALEVMPAGLPEAAGALEAEALEWASRAEGLIVDDPAGCTRASNLLVSIKTLRHRVLALWAPYVEAAMEVKRRAELIRKSRADERDRVDRVLATAEGHVKRALLAFEAEQEKARAELEARLLAEAQAEAEALTLAAAAALELEAGRTGDEGMRAEAFDILAQPIEAPAITVAVDVPRVRGVSYRDDWRAAPAIDLKALAGAIAAGSAPASFLVPDWTAINRYAKATKGAVDVPGIRWVNDRIVSARGTV